MLVDGLDALFDVALPVGLTGGGRAARPGGRARRSAGEHVVRGRPGPVCTNTWMHPCAAQTPQAGAPCSAVCTASADQARGGEPARPGLVARPLGVQVPGRARLRDEPQRRGVARQRGVEAGGRRRLVRRREDRVQLLEHRGERAVSASMPSSAPGSPVVAQHGAEGAASSAWWSRRAGGPAALTAATVRSTTADGPKRLDARS